MDEEARSLDALVTRLDEALFPISELRFHLEILRGLLVDVEHRYQVESTGGFSHISRLEHLEHSLAGVDASLNQIATVVKSIPQ